MTTSPTTDPILEELMRCTPASTEAVRTVMDAFFLRMAKKARIPEIRATLRDIQFSRADDKVLALDIYQPCGDGLHPVLIFLHGGGFIMGNSRTYDHVCSRIAAAGFLVCSVNYRLAPEYPFPAGFEDCSESVRWVVNNIASYGGDDQRIALGGDSAGGNLAAGVAASFGQNADNPISALILAYATLEPPRPKEWVSHGPVPKMLLDAYVGDNDFDQMCGDSRYNPLLVADRMPPTCLVCGEADPLVTDSRSLASKLKEHSVPCEERYFPNMPHGFIQMSPIFEEANKAIDTMTNFLHKSL